MSEYQYYEFQCVDRPLNAKEKEEISQISSRAKVVNSQKVLVGEQLRNSQAVKAA